MSDTQEVLDRFKYAVDAESKNRARALEAIKFRDLDGQWPDEIKTAREKDIDGARPCLTIDKTNQYIKQVCNDQRMNRPQIRVRPVDDYADVETAKVYNGIIRHIEANSRADIAYDRAFEHAADGGFGYFRFITDFCDPMSFDQDIIIKSIRNRFSVYLDPDHQEPEGSDSEWAFVTEQMLKEEYKKKYKGKDSEWSETGIGDQKDLWYQDKHIRVVEYFYIDHKPETLVLLEDGSVLTEREYLSNPGEKDYSQDAWKPTMSGGMERKQVIKDRKTKLKQVKWQKRSAQNVLDERDWTGIYIPIVKVIGNEIDVEGESRLSGMVRPAMDAQRMYNYAVSAFVEMVALAPKAPWVAADGQIENNESDWAEANRRNISVLTYTPINSDGVLVPAPQRQPMPGVPAGWATAMQAFENDIQGNMGIYKAALGAPSNETSGKAIIAKQREADASNFNYVDNLTRSMVHGGRILLDLIPKIYDTQRVARILGEDGASDMAYLNPEQEQAFLERVGPDGKKKKSYNLSVGKYDVAITVGPAYATKREESAQAMIQVTQAYPQLMQLAGDIMFRNLDWPGAEEIAERLKKTLPPELQGDDDDPENAQLQQMGQALQQAQMQLQAMAGELEAAQKTKADDSQLKQMELQLKAGEQRLKEVETMLKEREIAIKERETEIKMREASIKETDTTIKAYDAQTKRISTIQASQPVEEVAPEFQMEPRQPDEIAAAINNLASAMTQPITLVRDGSGNLRAQ